MKWWMNELMIYKWCDECINEVMNERINEYKDDVMNEWIDEHKDEVMN